MKSELVKYGLIAAVIAGIYFAGSSNDYVEDDIDLNRVLDVTVDTLHSYQEKIELSGGEPDSDQVFLDFSNDLAINYNNAQPTIYTKGSIGVSPQTDASLLAFVDANGNAELEESEELLFLIEIDGENARIIASSSSGAINEHHFSGTGLLTGYLIGSMLTRQRAAGVSSKSLASKKPITSRAAAKTRAGSGSHSKGK
jgi:hypothetical protein